MNYTPRQVSEMLGIPESTLRRWALLYRSHLSDQQGRKQRLYTDQDVFTFGQIKDLSARNIPLGEIGSRLVISGEVGQLEKDSSLALVPNIAARFEQLEAKHRAALDQISGQASTIEQLKDQLGQIASQLEEIKAKQKKPWFRRLFD